MKIYFVFLTLILLCFFPEESTAQTQELKFNLISGVNGISLGKINAITQDKYGFMWFSDQSNRSIIRYDGSAMTRYRNDPKNPNSLGGYYPECLFTDSTGFIWIGFYGQGLDKFDPESNTFTHYDHDPNDPESLSHDFVSAIRIDHLGNIWVGTNGGLDLLDPETGKFTHYRHDANDPTSLSDNVVRAIYEDHEGTLWVGTGFAYTFDITGGLNRFDRETGTFTRYLHDPENPQSLIDNKVRSIFEDSKGNFWIGTRGDGLHSMDRKTGLITRHTYDPANPDKLSSPPVSTRVSHVTFISEDAEKKLWIGSNTNGMNRYDPVTKKNTHFGNIDDNDLSAWCAYFSADGLGWIGTEQNSLLYKIDLYNHNFPHISNTNGVRSFYEDDSSVLWMATFGGLVRSDSDIESTTHFMHDPLNPKSLSSNYVTKITKDKLGYFWIGTVFGLNRFNPATGTFTRYLNDPNDSTSLGYDDIFDISIDSDSNLWIGTGGAGLELLNPKTGKFIHYINNPADTNSITNDLVNVIIDDKQNLWVGLTGGLNRLNKKTGNFKHYLTGLYIFDIYRDKGSTLWVGTQNGLYQYRKETDNFSPYFGPNVDLSINSHIWSIIEDDGNNLWIGSTVGIYRVNQERDNIILYGKKNGINGDRLIDRSVYKQKDGKILFGEVGGYIGFYPDQIKTLPGASKIYFTNLWINDKAISPGDSEPLTEPIIKAKEIRLGYDQNVFAISATSIDYRASEDKKIYYTLENYDQEWQMADVGEKVNYFKVPPGEYIFRIKSANSANGVWSEKSIDVNINPPWWLTWWAYTIYGIFFVAGVFMVDRIQRRRLLEKERSRVKDRELEQAKEIKKAYTELKTTQAQLIHSEKMASLGELTAGIAHEIQNPLNFVNNFSDVNSELAEELREEIEKGNIEEAKAIAMNIKDNEQKIVHHGKRAEEIVKSMLQHSRGSDGKKEPTDINTLADEYLRLAFHGMRAKDKSFNATMDTDFDPEIEKINIVPQDIGRVILNLITNAFYAVSEASVKETAETVVSAGKMANTSSDYKPVVKVSTKKLKDAVEIKVADNGTGIPQNIINKIYEPFFSTKSTGHGTGLGLSLSYDIITKGHGGTIEVESEEGKGTEFTIQLPIV